MKILLSVSRKITALQYYRQEMPHAALSRTNPEIIYTKLTTGEEGGFPDVMQVPDKDLEEYSIVSYLRQISFNAEFNRATVQHLHNRGKKIILDIDDWWRVPVDHAFHLHYKQYRIPEAIEQTLSMVDAVTVTTKYLAEKVSKFNRNVHILPNCIDPVQPQFTKRNIKNALIRFGWVGGVHHINDIELMREALKKAHSLPNVQFCVGGFNTGSEEYFKMENIFTNNYRLLLDDGYYLDYLKQFTPAVEHASFDKPYRRLWAKDINSYADIYNNIDVALCPIADNTFNRCKSELKLIEAGWMGKAVIASAVPPYTDVIEHGYDGFLVKSHRNNIDWYIYMKKFVEQPDLIKTFAARLEAKIKSVFNIYDVNKKRLALYNSMIK